MSGNEEEWCKQISMQHPSSNLEWVGEVTIHNNSTLGVVVKYDDGIFTMTSEIP